MSTDSLDATTAPARSVESLTALHWAGVALAAVTGGIHLWLGVTASKPPLAVAGVGFAAGVAAVLLGVRRASAVAAGVPFVTGQIVLYALGHGVVGPRALSVAPAGLADKAVQMALLAVLVVLWRRQ